MPRRLLPLALLVAGLLLPAPAEAAPRFASCPAEGEDATCARVPVPLDRSGRLAGSVGLRVLKIPARRRGRVPRAVVYLSGGPGGAGLEEARFGLRDVRSLRSDHALVSFDQRGTGGSGLLRCPELERDSRLRATEAAQRCAARIGPKRSVYTTRTSVEDLEAVRVAVGAERLLLYGVSYGTELALAYARTYPTRVERMILDSVVDPDDPDPFTLASYRAIGPSLAGLCPADCEGIGPDPGADLGRLVAGLEARPGALRAPVVKLSGARRTRALSALGLSDLLFDADYLPALRAAVPGAVAAAARGDAAPLLRLQELARPLGQLPEPRSFSTARFATICEEAPLPWPRGTPLAERPAVAQREADRLGPAAFAPFSYATVREDVVNLCLRWPDPPEPPPSVNPPYPDVPVLLLQGAEDLRTPPEISARVAAALPRSSRVVIPGIGHAVLASDPSRCAAGKLRRWLAGRPVGPACRRVPAQAPGGIPPRSLADLRSARGVRAPAAVGRTVTAIDRTLDDVVFVLSNSFGRRGAGLRGGTFTFSERRGLTLRGVALVRGVRLTGRPRRGGALPLRVTGGAAARGSVVLGTDGVLRGRLGGRRVAVALRAGPPGTRASGAAAAARAGAEARVIRHPRVLPVHRRP